LYGCEISSLTLRDEKRSRAFGNGVLRKTFGLKREEVTSDWIKLHNLEFLNLSSSENIIFEMELTRGDGWGTGAREIHMGFWMGKPEVKDYLGNLGVETKMTFTQRGWEGLYYIELAQDMDKSWGSSEQGNGTSGSITVPDFLAVC